jgi:hypothetical protein
VGGLLELANLALGGRETAAASLADIDAAVETINRAFYRSRLIESDSEVDVALELGRGSGAETAPDVPARFELGQNFPNPFNPTTRIVVSLPSATNWTLEVYDVTGRRVKRYGGYAAGADFVQIEWDGTNESGRAVGAGVYFYRVKAGEFSATKKMVLIK